MNDKDFDIVLSKNALARTIRDYHKIYNIGAVPEYIKFQFDEIEKKTGTANQPSAREILSCFEFNL